MTLFLPPPIYNPTAVHIIYAVIKYKTDAGIKEVIILDVFPMFIFTP